MNEAELSYHLSMVLDRIWSMQQWWASVSIGVLIMAHLATSRLNLFLVILSLALYLAHCQRTGGHHARQVHLVRDNLRGHLSECHGVSDLQLRESKA